MRFTLLCALASSLVLHAACLDGTTPQDLLDGAVLGSTAAADEATWPAVGPGVGAAPPREVALSQGSRVVIEGELAGSGAYRVFDLGAGEAGDLWRAAPLRLTGSFVAVLFDADYNLLMRRVLTDGRPLQHVLRVPTPQVRLAVAPVAGGSGGEFRIEVTREAGSPVPAPAGQLVWLNFGGASDVRVHRRSGLSFPPFDAGRLGDAYAGHSDVIKRAIVEAIRADYAAFNITILSSDDGPPPAEPHTVVHFGGSETALLGLADSIDNYNQVPAQSAIVFVDSFGAYHTMNLSPEQMAVMIANVASHELGHLLGLYHTRKSDDLMDTTGTAWDLAGAQGFGRAPLETNVFPIGMEDSPQLLMQTLGPGAAADKEAARAAARKQSVHTWLRRFAEHETRCGCGTCLALDN